MMKKLYLLCFCILGNMVFSQAVYKLKLKNYRVGYFEEKLKETSGLAWLDGKLYTINDSGNSSEYYEINPKNAQIIAIHEVNFPNKDWEAITSDGEYLYIADIGNNAGSRRDLAIYKLGKNAEYKIPFFYANQIDFSPKLHRTDYDAEAIIFKDGKINLFSKEWKSHNISRYIIDPNTENTEQKIEILEKFPLKFLATDTAYFDKKLYVVGYNKLAKAFLMIFDEDEKGNFFSGKYKKYRLGSVLKYGQIEGIAVNKNGIYISSEAFEKLIFRTKSSLYFIPHSK